LKKKLRWDTGKSWFDHGGMGLLMYAVTADEFHVVSKLLRILKRDFNGDEYSRRLESRVRDEGYVSLGIPGGATTLMAAMAFASFEVVLLLLQCGASIQSVDVMGNDAFMFASLFGRPENMECWLEKV
jgi:ankyrin repeat protein